MVRGEGVPDVLRVAMALVVRPRVPLALWMLVLVRSSLEAADGGGW